MVPNPVNQKEPENAHHVEKEEPYVDTDFDSFKGVGEFHALKRTCPDRSLGRILPSVAVSAIAMPAIAVSAMMVSIVVET